MKTKVLIAHIVTVLCLCFPAMLAAQDNWQKEIQHKPTPEKIEWILTTYNGGTKYVQHYPEMLELGMNLALQSDIDTLIGRMHLCLGSYYQQNGRFDESCRAFDAAKFIFLKGKKYPNAAFALYRQSTLLVVQGMGDSLLTFLKKHQRFVDAASNNINKLRWKTMYALAYQQLSKNRMARETFEEMLPEVELCGDTQLVLSTYVNLVRYYNDFDSSMALLSKGLAMSDNFPEKRTELLVKIGYTYMLRDDKLKDSALYYFMEAKKNSHYLRNPIFRCNIDALIGDFFMNGGEHGLALPYQQAAYQCGKDMGLVHRATAAHNLAVCFIGLRNVDSAAVYLEIHRQDAQEMDNDYQYMLYYHARGEFEALKGDSCSLKVLQNFDKSIAYAIKMEEDRVGVTTLISAMGCITKVHSAEMKPLALSMLEHCHAYYNMVEKHTDTKRARSAEFMSLYAKLESMYGDKAKANTLYEELVKQLTEMQESDYIKGLGEAVVKYKSDLLATEVDLLNEREHAATVRSILIVVGLLLMICIAIIIYVLYRREHKTRQMLDERNHKVEQLLREVHHRVKNNLQIVSSFINIQLDKVTDSQARTALEDTSTRIMALAGLHQSLYRQGDLAKIHLSQYIEELCRTLGAGINKDVVINCDLEELQLNIDQAIPIGLAVNELITNALKHAFSHKDHGQIDVVLKHAEKWQLMVKDNGEGLPEEINTEALQSIGIRLVQDIAERQLNGTFSYYNEQGAVFKIEFVPIAA